MFLTQRRDLLSAKLFYFQGRPVCHNKISQMDFLILPRYEKFLDEQSMCVKFEIKMESLKSAHNFLKFNILLTPSLIRSAWRKGFHINWFARENTWISPLLEMSNTGFLWFPFLYLQFWRTFIRGLLTAIMSGEWNSGGNGPHVSSTQRGKWFEEQSAKSRYQQKIFWRYLWEKIFESKSPSLQHTVRKVIWGTICQI